MLFDDGYIALYPEVVSLLYSRLVLDAMPDDAMVELDVQQVVETEADVRALHSDLAYELLHKVDVYERVFRALSAREEDVQDRYARTQVRNSLASLQRAGDAQAKREALESLMAAAFSIKPQLQVVERTYSTGDEEIDLIVKNNVARPFWQSLGSPLIFVECKNWTAPVGAPEVRNFEVKLQNHTPMTRVGILVAPGGFTSEAINAIKRSSRDPYSIALAKREDLEHLAYGAETVLDWLERILYRPM
jgi:restriction endonuclease Mrr